MGTSEGNSSGRWMRRGILVLAGLATAAMLALVVLVVAGGLLSSGEQLTRNIGWAILEIYGLPWVVCVLPALVLAALNRWLPLALALSILAAPLAYLIANLA